MRLTCSMLLGLVVLFILAIRAEAKDVTLKGQIMCALVS